MRTILQLQFCVLLFANVITIILFAALFQPAANSSLAFGGWIVVGTVLTMLSFFSWKTGASWVGKDARKSLVQALSHSEEALILANRNGQVVYVNKALGGFIQDIDMGDLLGFNNLSSLAKLIAPGSIQDFRHLQKNSQVGHPIRTVVEIVTAGGKRFFWRIEVDPVGASPDLSIWTLSNITAQKEFESKREEERRFMFDLLNELPVGFFSADQDGKLQYVNNTLAGWLSIKAGTYAGTDRYSLAEFVVRNEQREHEPAVESDATGMHGGLRLQNGDGESFSAYLIQSQQDATNGEFMYSRSLVLREPFTPVVDDGTGAQLLRRIPWLFSDSPVGIVILDLEGTVVDCNRSFLKILGLHRDGVVGRPISDRISKEDRESADAALSKVVMRIMRATLLEVRIPADGERQITASFYVSCIESDDTEVTGLVLHVIDTTERKNLEVQFNQAQKMQAVGQLAGGVAHDFNNLLTAMGGFCDLLLGRHEPDDPDFSDITQIKENTMRAGDLVRQLLAFSRRQTLQPKIFSITDALNRLSTTLRRVIGENIEMELSFGKDVDLIRTDEGQFDQVVINLAVNARDAMPGGGKISIITEVVSVEKSVQRGHDVMPAGEYIRIDVTDTGSGIAQENITRIFEPFFTTKSVGEGTGLGLSTVYGIIRQSDGYIFPESAIGEGSTFSIYLPAFSAAEVKAFGGEISQIGGEEVFDDKELMGEATVLLVEDEDAVRIFGSRALKNKGYRVLEAEDGEQALDVINEFGSPIDLIITDVMMPGMDGHTLVRLVQEELPDIKVILMSGYAEDAIPGEIAESGGVNFLSKPFSLQKLAEKVKEVIAT